MLNSSNREQRINRCVEESLILKSFLSMDEFENGTPNLRVIEQSVIAYFYHLKRI